MTTNGLRLITDDLDRHTVAQFHISRQSNRVGFAEPAEDFVVRGIGNPQPNFAFGQHFLAETQTAVGYYKDVVPAAFRSDRPARNHEHVLALLSIDAHT